MKITKIQSKLTTRYHVLHDTCKIHGRDIKTRYFGSILILKIREGLKFYQTRSNAIILQGTLPANFIVRAERLRNGEKLYERQYLSPRPPPKISLKHDLNWSKGKDQGSTVEHRPVEKRVQQSLGETLQPGSSKATQFPKPIEDRSGRPVAQEIVGKSQEKPPDEFSLSVGRLTKKQTTSRPDYLWPELWEKMSEAAQRKEK